MFHSGKMNVLIFLALVNILRIENFSFSQQGSSSSHLRPGLLLSVSIQPSGHEQLYEYLNITELSSSKEYKKNITSHACGSDVA